ncbi:MAG: VTT domain-containing protein [Planctomycetes bacterium]|nr:VTT domain-containing protein [Planctomycetota bacterium]
MSEVGAYEEIKAASELGYRRWFWPFAVGFGMTMLAAAYGVQAGMLPRSIGHLAFFTAYMSLACTFCPLPTAWIFLWMGRDFHPFLVATLGALGTCVANLNDYYLLSFLLRYRLVDRVRATRTYHVAVRWFDKAPFLILSAATFLPISVDVVRLLAISRRYSRKRFALATFVGRWPRYIILALIGRELQLSWMGILMVFVALALIGLGKFAWDLVRRKNR